MSAAHGFADSSRFNRRPIGHPLALAVALAVFAVLAPAANARTKPPVSTYLALGDSISFGYSEQVFNENFPNESPSFFEDSRTTSPRTLRDRPRSAGA